MPRHREIELKRLADETQAELQIKHIDGADGWSEMKSLPVHRDDCFLFILLESGDGEIEIDFHRIAMSGPHLCFIRPGQVHHKISGHDARAWVLRADSSLISAEYSRTVAPVSGQTQHFALTRDRLDDFTDIMRMIQRHIDAADDRPLWRRTTGALMSLFLCETASVAASLAQDNTRRHPRQAELCNRFRRFLAEHPAEARTPAQCASALCISTPYLNEVVRNVTGFSVSHWIRESIMLEAKRLLCFTDKSIKEVAFAAGYDDPVYFTRQFRKHTGIPPAAFRAAYRE